MAKLILGKIIKRVGISKAELARRLGGQYHNVFKLFHDDYNPNFKRLTEIAHALGVRVRDLIGDDPKPRKKTRLK